MTDDRAFVILQPELRDIRRAEFINGLCAGWLLTCVPTLVYLWWRGFI